MNEIYYKNKRRIDYLKTQTAAADILLNTITEIIETDQYDNKQKDLILYNLFKIRPQNITTLNDLEDYYIDIFGEDYDVYFNREYRVNKYTKGAR